MTQFFEEIKNIVERTQGRSLAVDEDSEIWHCMANLAERAAQKANGGKYQMDKLKFAEKVHEVLDSLHAGLDSDALDEQIGMICHEGSVSGFCSTYSSVKLELNSLIAFYNRYTDEVSDLNNVYEKWASSPMGDMLLRSTSASDGGRPERSAWSQEVLETVNTHMVAMLGQDCRMQDTIVINKDGEDVKLTFTAIDHKMWLEKMDQPAADMTAVDKLWQERTQKFDSYVIPAKYAEPEVLQRVKNIYYSMEQDLETTCCRAYPNLTPMIDLFGFTFDLEGAALKSMRLLERNKYTMHPLEQVHFLIYDFIDFRIKGLEAAICFEKDCFAGIMEHTTIKVQRLGARPISIQNDRTRQLQQLVQMTPLYDNDALLTGERGDGQIRLFEAQIQKRFTHSASGSKMSSRKDPSTSIAVHLDPISEEYKYGMVMEQAMSSIFDGYCLKMAIESPECPEMTRKEAKEQIDQAVESMAILVPPRDVAEPVVREEDYTTMEKLRQLNTAKQFIDSKWVLKSVETICKDTHKAVSKVLSSTHDPLRNYTAAETDFRAFTDCCSTLMHAIGVLGVKRDLTGSNAAAHALSVLTHLVLARTLYVMHKNMHENSKPHGVGCECCDWEKVKNIYGKDELERLGIPEEFWAFPANGGVNQGFSTQTSSVAVHLAFCSTLMRMWISINGDDQTTSCSNIPMRTLQTRLQYAMTQATEAEGVIIGGMKMDWMTEGNTLDKLGCAANFFKLTSIRSLLAGTIGVINAKKSSIRMLESGADATTVVYNILTASGLLRSTGNSIALSLGTCDATSYPALVGEWYSKITSAADHDGFAREAGQDVLRCVQSILPRVDIKWAESVRRSRLETNKDDMSLMSKKSIWSGTSTILTDPVKALAEIETDEEAPEWARALASRGLFVCPRGTAAPDRLQKSDELGLALQALKENPTVQRQLAFRKRMAPPSMLDAIRKNAILKDTDKNPESYVGATMYRITTENDCTPTYRLLGDPIRSTSKITFPGFTLKFYPGSVYTKDKATEPPGLLIYKSSYRPGGYIMSMTKPDYAESAVEGDGLSAHVKLIVPSGSKYDKKVQTWKLYFTSRTSGYLQYEDMPMQLMFTFTSDYSVNILTQRLENDLHSHAALMAAGRYISSRLKLDFGQVKVGEMKLIHPGPAILVGGLEHGPNRADGGSAAHDRAPLPVPDKTYLTKEVEVSVDTKTMAAGFVLNRENYTHEVKRLTSINYCWYSLKKEPGLTTRSKSLSGMTVTEDLLNEEQGVSISEVINGGRDLRIRFYPEHLVNLSRINGLTYEEVLKAMRAIAADKSSKCSERIEPALSSAPYPANYGALAAYAVGIRVTRV